MPWFLQVLTKYSDFSGRSRRKEYWYFILVSLLISIPLLIIDNMTGTFNAQVGLGLLSGIFSLAILFPSVAVTVRRLHDTGRSGWWFLIAFVPIVGDIVLIVFMVLDSQPGANEYGASPKDGSAPA